MKTAEDLTKEQLIRDLTELRSRIGELERSEEDKKKYQEELSRTKSMFEGLFEFAPDAIIVVRRDGSMERANKQAEKLFGYSRNELLNLHHEILLPERFRKVHMEHRRKYMAEPHIRPMGTGLELYGRRKDGSEFAVDIALGSLKTEEDMVVLAVIRDVSALKESEQRFATFMRQLPAVAWMKDLQGRYEYANAEAERIFSIPMHELLGKTDFEVFPPEIAQQFVDNDRRLLAEGGRLQATETLLQADGIEHHSVVSRFAVPGPDGQPLHIAGIAFDITDVTRAEENLRESREQLQIIIDTVPSLISYVGRNFHYLWNNRAYQEWFQRSAEEITGKHMRDVLGETVFQRILPRLQKALAGEVVEYDDYLEYPTGGRWVHGIYMPHRAANSEVDGIVVFVSDITERRRAEEALQESEARLNSMTSTALDAIILIDNDGNVSFWNEAATKIFGYTSEEVIGKYLHFFIMPERHIDQFSKGFKIFQSTGEGPFIGAVYEVEAKRKDGTEFPVEISLAPLKLKGKWNAIGIVRDITERKQTEEELQKAQRIESIGLLAGGIAHDFNNILTAILGNIGLVRALLPPGDKADERLKAAEHASMRARGLSQQLLTFAKGGAPVRKKIILSAAIMEAVELALRGSGCRAETFFPADLRPVEVDESQLSQAINNLVINAIQAMPGGGVLSVAAANMSLPPYNVQGLAAGEYVRVDIKDQGEGIPEELRGKIFDPFFTTKERGSGLGLSISFSIIKRHGGTITVDSRSGEGSTFSIFLPASKEEMVAPRKERQEKIMQGSGRILVMDDEEIVNEIAAEMLQYLGYRTQTVRDGAAAITAYQHAIAAGEPFDIVITDLTVPGGMGGKATVQRLLAIDPQAKVIVSSGYGNDPIMSNFAEYGFKGVIPKPYRLDELGKILREVIGEKEELEV